MWGLRAYMIIKNDEALLRIPCDDVLPEEIDGLRLLLEEELQKSIDEGVGAIGLAAPQIGVHKKMAIVRLSEEFSVDLINCYIDSAYDEFTFVGEACLSFPDLISDTRRYAEIYVKNNLGTPNSFVATGLFAVVIQHELDHINGILLPDRVIKPRPKVNIGPNEPCFCGIADPVSGKVKKYKKCHGK
jgi:peptide deformylase